MDSAAATEENGREGGEAGGRPLARIAVANFRSIQYLDLTLPNVAILTGRNGSGKSNVIDVFRFVKQAHDSTLESAIRERKGIERVRRHSHGHPFNITIRMDFVFENRVSDGFPRGGNAVYVFQISSGPAATFFVRREQAIFFNEAGKVATGFNFQDRKIAIYGKSQYLRFVDDTVELPNDRLYLNSIGFSPELFLLSRSIASMDVYNIDPSAIRASQSHDAGDLLATNGANLASVVKRLHRDGGKDETARILEHLKAISPEVQNFGCETSGSSDVLYFEVTHKKGPSFKIYPSNISDGSLRALAVLVAIFVRPQGPYMQNRVLLLEEPETALHPGAAAVLMDAIMSISHERQVILTTHSPSLLSHDVVAPNTLFGVSMHDGATQIDRVDAAAREAISDQLFSAGELLQKEQLFSDVTARHEQVDPNRLFVSGVRPARREASAA